MKLFVFPFFVIPIVLAVAAGTLIETRWCDDADRVSTAGGDRLCVFVEKDRGRPGRPVIDRPVQQATPRPAFDAAMYANVTDCLNAAALAGAPLSACRAVRR